MAEIVGTMASIAGPVIELGKCIIAPIKRQFNYFCCFNSNIKSLRDEAEKLKSAREGLKLRVAEAQNNAQLILPDVEAWLKRANAEIEVNSIAIENEISKVPSGYLSIKLRFSLSKKARLTTEAMKELRECCNFNHISRPAPPLATNPIPLGQTYEFESRKQIEEDIMVALRGEKVNMMGICGMGGVGKTMMAKRIMNRVNVEHLFDEVAMSVVSQQVDVMKIQREIAESLGLTLKEETVFARAHQLRARLKGNKRILIVLDDIWERLKLEDLGLITPPQTGVEGHCTILLTSRDKDVLNAMEAQKVFAIQTLSEGESWFLFREKVGHFVDDRDLFFIAKQVANECKGLPIALVTVGSALKDKKGKPIWEDALKQLKDSNPIDMPHVLKDVYNPLKLSYDFLDSPHARSLFLLCCLFPEDYNISLQHLSLYCMGLRMFEGIQNLEQVRNRLFTLVEMLKNRFLILDGFDNNDVRMHDVVRDVAIYVASKEGFIDLNLQKMNWSSEQYSYSDCRWISLFQKSESKFPNLARMNFPSLGLFMVHCQREEYSEIKDWFEGMEGLNVLSFQSIYLESLPQTIQLLKNLRTLHIQDCAFESISAVGELSNLEILSCNSCLNIRELPVEIGRLKRLKLLEFSSCRSLKTIKPEAMSNLVALEELTFIGSFRGWELAKVNREVSQNVCLNELQSLSNLTCLKIEVDDFTLAAEEIHLSSKLVRYCIAINQELFSKDTYYWKTVALNLPTGIALGNWVQILLRDTERLHLEGNGSNSLDLSQANNIKSLYFSSCSTIKALMSTTTSIYSSRFDVFPMLEDMLLYNLPNLEAICQSPNQNIWPANLSSLIISACAKLLNIFPLPMAKGLLQLQMLFVYECETMEELFSNDESGMKDHIAFPKLKTLALYDLPNLRTFSKGIETIDFPVLNNMDITGCPNLTSIVSPIGTDGHDHDHEDDTSLLFCSPKVTFGMLKELRITRSSNICNQWCHPISDGFFTGLEQLDITQCDGIRSLFSSAIAKSFVNLKDLSIESCNEIVKVIEDEPEEIIRKPNCPLSSLILFPRLEKLILWELPKLGSFCEWRCELELSALTSVVIKATPLMKTFTMGSLTTPELKSVKLDNYVYNEDQEDLNSILRLHFTNNAQQRDDG